VAIDRGAIILVAKDGHLVGAGPRILDHAATS
jgi:hypothetical protein